MPVQDSRIARVAAASPRPSTRTRPGLEALEGRALLSAGDLDASFGGTGRVIADYTGAAGLSPGASEVALQSDGKVLLAGGFGSTGFPGGSTSAPFQFGVERLNADGTPDTSFGGGTGRVAVTYPGIVNHFSPYVGSLNDMQVAPDGKIDLLFQIPGPDSNFQLVFAVARLNPDGTPDTSFSGDGFAAFRFIRIDLDPSLPADFDQASSLTVAPDGSMVAAGHFETGDPTGANQRDMMLIRIKADGSLDTSFQNGPRLTIVPLEPGLNLIDFTDVNGASSESLDTANVVRTLPDGSFLVAGSTEIKAQTIPPGGFVPDSYSAEHDFAVAKLRPDGSLDTSFGHGGRLTWNIRDGSWEAIDDMIVQPDGKILLMGRTSQAGDRRTPDIALTRLNPDGSFDTTFDGDGKATIDLGGSNQAETPRSILLQPDGKIVIVGMAAQDSTFTVLFKGFVLHLNADGSRDATYGTDGLAPFALPAPGSPLFSIGGNFVYEATLQPDGKVVGTAVDRSPNASDANFVFRIVADSATSTGGGTTGGGTTGGGTTGGGTTGGGTTGGGTTGGGTVDPGGGTTGGGGVVVIPPPQDLTPPRILGVTVTTNKKTKLITGIVIRFSEALDIISAQATGNYDFRPTTRKAKPIKVKRASYDPGTNSVTLTVAGKLPGKVGRRLTLQNVADLARNLLDGDANGSAGGSYTAVVKGPR